MKKIFNINYERDYSIITYILIFFVFSFIGWLWEALLHIFLYDDFVNRGVLYGPYLPIYGVGGVLILILFKKYRNNPFKVFIYSFFLCGIVEYMTGWFFETFMHVKYWDYSEYILNIQGRICLWVLAFFGIGGLFFTYILAPLLDDLFKKIKTNIKKIIVIILLSIFSIDLLYSVFVEPNSGAGITEEIKYISTQY